MSMDEAVIASGNLATARRTIMGVRSQCALLQVDSQSALQIFTACGLPERALDELDFPISLEQELQILAALVRRFSSAVSSVYLLFSSLEKLGIETLGVLGMAMRHAQTAVDALKICLTYPQLTGGHSRLLVTEQSGKLLFSFTMERPSLRDIAEADVDNLVHYCLALDLLTTLRNIDGIVKSGLGPLYIDFPFEEPADWADLATELPCPVHFSQAEACLAYSANLADMQSPHANALLYQSYVSIAEKMSQMLAEEFSFRDRVSRWLWAYTPPPNRGEIAALLAMSERNLTRQLGKEGTSYSKLLAQVQEERAKNFLKNPAPSVAEIGYRLGYAEPAAFSRAFKQWTGLSPGRWRKKVLT
jgi:AraC-like DNA-binding protein